MVSAQREVVRLVGIGAVLRSKESLQTFVALMSNAYAGKIQGDNTVTSLMYGRVFVTWFTSNW